MAEETESLFDQVDEAAEAEALAEAEADIAAGRTISHERVVEWVRSWGTDHELPPPECDEA